MIIWKLPKEALEDPFRPPCRPRDVFCLHCGKLYSSDQLRWRRCGGQWAWCCPTPGCDGRGYRFDIFPLAEPRGASTDDAAAEDDQDGEAPEPKD
jgi:hypothetical protein